MLPAWRVLPEPVRDFVAQLLTVDPKERLTADAALEHDELGGARLGLCRQPLINRQAVCNEAQ